MILVKRGSITSGPRVRFALEGAEFRVGVITCASKVIDVRTLVYPNNGVGGTLNASLPFPPERASTYGLKVHHDKQSERDPHGRRR